MKFQATPSTPTFSRSYPGPPNKDTFNAELQYLFGVLAVHDDNGKLTHIIGSLCDNTAALTSVGMLSP